MTDQTHQGTREASSPLPSSGEFSYQIFTDGSNDPKDPHGTMAWASVAYDPATASLVYRGGSSTGGSVRRAEMMGLLAGLHVVGQFDGILADEKKRMSRVHANRPVVVWFTDRQEVAYAITPPEGQRPYSRRNDADLWAQISWWEGWYRIQAVHVARNTVGPQAECDRVAGVLRKLLKEKVLEWTKDEKNPTILQ